MYRQLNLNPKGIRTGDCVIRAVAKVFNESWESAYMKLCAKGLLMYDLPNSNAVLDSYLRDNGFKRMVLPNSCPNCYSINEFCRDNRIGTYIVSTGSHVVAVIDGIYYDSWNSGNEIPIYFWKK